MYSTMLLVGGFILAWYGILFIVYEAEVARFGRGGVGYHGWLRNFLVRFWEYE